MENGDLLHEANLCVFKTCCDGCINNTPNDICIKCGNAVGKRVRISMDVADNVDQKTPVEWFLEFVMEKRKVGDRILININFNFSVLGFQECSGYCA